MTADDRLEIRRSLEEQLEDLTSREVSLSAEFCPDENEYASRVYDLHVSVSLRERESRRAALVQAALRRLADPQYGVCRECGEDIGLARLKANPVAEFCVACQAELEIRPQAA